LGKIVGRMKGVVVVGFAAEEGEGEVGDDACAEEEGEREDLLMGG